MVCQRASTSTWEEGEEEESDLVYHWIPKYILLFPSHTMTTNNHVCRWDVLWPKRSIVVVVFVVSSCGSRTSSLNRTWRKRARTYTSKFQGKKGDWMNDGREIGREIREKKKWEWRRLNMLINVRKGMHKLLFFPSPWNHHSNHPVTHHLIDTSSSFNPQ